MQNQGYIKLYRKLLDSEIMQFGAPGIGFMAYCLLKANHKDNRWFDGSKFVEIKRGQFVTSSLELANELKLGRQVIRTTIRKFEELEIITTKPTNKYTLITLLNYGKYQDKYATPNQQTNQQTTKSQPADQPQSKKIKNDKNEKKEKIIKLHRAEGAGEPSKNDEPSAETHDEPFPADEPSKIRNPDIKRFIDFFCEATKRIRRERAMIVRGKDGRLVKLALQKVSESQLEQLAIWHLERNRHMQATIGAMLAQKSLEILRNSMNRSDFWKEINAVYDQHWPRLDYTKMLAVKFQPFTYEQIADIAEDVARQERAIRI